MRARFMNTVESAAMRIRSRPLHVRDFAKIKAGI